MLHVQFVFLLIKSVDLDVIFHCSPLLALHDLSFFCLQVLLTRASLLALAKSIYYELSFVFNLSQYSIVHAEVYFYTTTLCQ